MTAVTQVHSEHAATPEPAPKTTLRLDIEGLRAVAVGTVLLYHMGVKPLSGGFAGVDVFFVISGYLITSLLVREATRTGSVSITDFYARRARRLLPAATVVLVFTAMAGWWVLPASDHRNLATDVGAATMYVVNWALAFRSVDYLAEDAGLSPVQHYWSLSVEEQYYVVWPLLIIVGLMVARRLNVAPRRLLFGIVGVAAAASFLYSVVHTKSEPATAYFFTTTRVWELGAGSLLVFATLRLRGLRKSGAQALGLLGLGLIGIAVFAFTSKTPWPGSAALLPVLGAGCVIAAGCATTDTVAGRLLSWKPMVWVGGLSYSIYLWHWPLLVLADVRWPDLATWQTVGIGLLSIPLAWLTKHLVEDPIRFNPVISRRPSLALLGGAAMMCCSLVAAGLVWQSAPTLDADARVTGATALIRNPEANDWQLIKRPARVYTNKGTLHPDPAVAIMDSPIYYDIGCQVDQGVEDPAPGCVFGAEDSATKVVMLGDSKMGQWFSAIDAIADAEDWRLRLYLKSACTFSLDGVEPDCAAHTRKVLDRMREKGAPDFAFVSQGKPVDPELSRGMQSAMAELKALGTKIVVIADSPMPNRKKVYQCVERHPDNFRACSVRRDERADGMGTPLLTAVARELDLPVVTLNQWICPPGPTCPPAIAGTLILRQGSHITDSYIRTLTPMLHRALSDLGVAKTPVGTITPADVPDSQLK